MQEILTRDSSTPRPPAPSCSNSNIVSCSVLALRTHYFRGHERLTRHWQRGAARTSPTTFWIFDTFGTEDARQAHINGEIAAALMAKADELLASPPEILAAEVLASK
jgi:quinol monooxygenase YgiN